MELFLSFDNLIHNNDVQTPRLHVALETSKASLMPLVFYDSGLIFKWFVYMYLQSENNINKGG
jgi:hypothetical protein